VVGEAIPGGVAIFRSRKRPQWMEKRFRAARAIPFSGAISAPGVAILPAASDLSRAILKK